MRLADERSAFELGGEVSVWNRLIPQKRECVVDQEARGIKNDKNFRDQRLRQRLAGFTSDGGGDFRFLRMQLSLKLAHDRDTAAHAEFRPSRLRGFRSLHRGTNFGFPCALEFAQNFAGCRIDRCDRSRGTLRLSSHQEMIVGRGTTGYAFWRV